jgi:glutathione S-transferase
VRLLLNHLGMPFEQVLVSIFEAEGQDEAYRSISPTGTVPALRLEDGRVLAESNAILMYLADGTRYLPDDAFGRAKVWQWLSFEQERVESQIGALRHWTLTGKLARRPEFLVGMKRKTALNALAILEAELSTRDFIAADRYTIADMSLFAYASRADDAQLPLSDYPAVQAWIARVQAQPGFLPTMYPYSIDPHTARDLP